MNNIYATLAVGIGWIIIGYPFARKAVQDRYERYALALLLGSGLTTAAWFIAYRMGFSLTVLSYITVSIMTWAAGYVMSHRYQDIHEKAPVKGGRPDIFLTGAIVLALVSAFLIGSYNPLTAWDSLALYDFRAHAIAVDHNLKFMENSIYYLSYPLMISLCHAIVYMIGGVSAQGLHAIFFASFVGIIYGRLKSWTNLRFALIGTLCVAYSNQLFEHATFAYTNLPYITFLIAGYCYLISGKLRHIVIGSTLVGLSSWIRVSEPFWLLAIVLIVWEAWRRKSIVLLGSIVLVMIFRVLWFGYYTPLAANLAIPGVEGAKYSLSHIPLIVGNVPAVMSYIKTYVLYPYHGFWMAVLPIVFVATAKRNIRLGLLALIAFCSLALIVGGVMIFSAFYTTWDQIGDSAMRMAMYIVPLVWMAGVYGLYVGYDKRYGNK